MRNTVRSANAPARFDAAAHTLKVESAYQAMLDAQDAVKQARACGDEGSRQAAAIVARDCRATYLSVSGTAPEAATYELDLGSETSPVRAV